MRAVATPLLDGVATIPYAAVAAVHADPTVPMPALEASTLLRDFTDGTIDAIVSAAGPQSSSPLAIVEVRQFGGALTDEQAVRSALCHRDSAFQLFAVGVLAPPIADLVPAAVAELLAAVGPWSTGTSLPNFTPSGDPDMIRRCYDEDTYAWLAALAARLDPRGVLHTGQVVR